MPGIAGIVTRNPDSREAEAQLSTMLRVMRHSPHCAQASFSDTDRGLYLGWVNHSGISGSTENEAGDVSVIFHGEHFSPSPERLGPHAPTAILKAFEEDPDVFPRTLNGWFAGVIVDRPRRKVLLFNDRYGMQRIHYWGNSERFVFASEAKALLHIIPQLRSLDADAVGQYLGYGTVFGNRTLFNQLQLLPAGSCWSIAEPHNIAQRRYFHPAEWADQPAMEPAAFHDALHETLRRILPPYFSSPTEPVGLSLTGGLDTRIVVAGMPDGGERHPCYTYGGIYRDCFDIQIARRISSACGLPHVVIPLEKDFFDNFRDHAEQSVRVTDGCLDITGAHEIYYSTRARHYSPVRLTGNYGSEVLRNVSTFKLSPVTAELLCPDAVRRVDRARQEHEELRATHPVSFAAFCMVPWHLAGRRLAADSMLVLRSPYLDNDLVRLIYRAPAGARESSEASVDAIRAMSPRLAAIPTDMGYGGQSRPFVGTMDRLYRYLLFKAEWYYNMGMPDVGVRHERHVPLRALERFFLGTHKIEHYRLWFRNELKASLLDILSGSTAASRSYVARPGLRRLLNDFDQERRNCARDVSRLASLELVQQTLIDGGHG